MTRMTREDILRMADEACELAKKDLLNGDYLTTGFLAIRDIHFHRLATAAERAECIKIAEEWDAPIIAYELRKRGVTP